MTEKWLVKLHTVDEVSWVRLAAAKYHGGLIRRITGRRERLAV
jgi:hypothetical protein